MDVAVYVDRRDALTKWLESSSVRQEVRFSVEMQGPSDSTLVSLFARRSHLPPQCLTARSIIQHKIHQNAPLSNNIITTNVDRSVILHLEGHLVTAVDL